MTYLELCVRLVQEARISGTGPVSVIGQTGEMLLVTQWINTALQNLWGKYGQWQFARFDFSFPTISGVSTYPSTAAVPDLLRWITDDTESMRCWRTSIGSTDERYLIPISWDDFRDVRLFSTSRTQTGTPLEYAVKPNNDLIFWPIPDDTYTISGEFYCSVTSLVNNSDVPAFPADFHMLIVWEALRLTGAYQKSPENYMHGQAEYRRMLNQIRRQYLLPVDTGMPLA